MTRLPGKDSNAKPASQNFPSFLRSWSTRALRSFPPSLRKLEGDGRVEEKEQRKQIFQFNFLAACHSILRSCPPPGTMKTSRVPILGAEERPLSLIEGVMLVPGVTYDFLATCWRPGAFKVPRIAVHSDAVFETTERLLPTRAPSETRFKQVVALDES